MIRVLHVVSALGSGGVENLLYNYYKHIDTNQITFDFIVHSENIGVKEREFMSLGSSVYHVVPKRINPIRNARKIKEIIKNGGYDIVHAHQDYMSFIPLLYAKKYGVHTRISHSHLAHINNSGSLNNLLVSMFKIINKHYATDYFACSVDASLELFGKKEVDLGKPIVMKNAIDVEQYTFSESKREQIRKELGVEEKFVIGNIGRFTYQKNHTFIIDIFSKVYKKNENSVLLLIGEGEGKQKIERKVKELGLEKAVRFLGVRSDIPDLMQAMDVFLFPSNFEGLGIVLIEAQASGLQCIASKKVIPKETNITDFIEYISLEESSENWANAVLRYGQGYKRKNTSEQIKIAGYDLLEQSKWLENYYKTRG
ncbi:glycosyltransferase family 1 protein [Salinicoccus roseus]|uniref:glycosyltransferase family 1 protein n=1 Tax=Salinicoccus roseus TaxID=45670 RepID=UPI0022FFCF95|nr:glycosyltransferase family 1 protein [Salinicoccus roseus]